MGIGTVGTVRPSSMPPELADDKIEDLEWGEILGFEDKENVLSL